MSAERDVAIASAGDPDRQVHITCSVIVHPGRRADASKLVELLSKTPGEIGAVESPLGLIYGCGAYGSVSLFNTNE